MKIYVALVFALHILNVRSGPLPDDSWEDSGEEGVSEEKGTWDIFNLKEAKESFLEIVDSAVEFVDSAVELGDNVIDNVVDLFSYNDPSPNPTYDVDTSNNANGFGDNPDLIPLLPTPPVVYSQKPNKNPAKMPVPPVAYDPPRKFPQPPTKNPTPNPASQPQGPSQTTPQTSTNNSPTQTQPTVSSQLPPENSTPNPSPQPQDPSQMTPQTITENPLPEDHPTMPPQIPPSLDTHCTCTPFFKCYDEETSSNLTGVVDDRNPTSCPNPNDVCCHNLVQPVLPPTNNQTSQPHDPSEIFPEISTQIPSLEPEPTFPSHIYPSDANCTCTPFFRCYDEETSSNLTDIVDDRIKDIQESCSNPTDVCCYNLVQPVLPPNNNQSSNPLGPPQISPENSTQNPSTDTPLTFPENPTQSPSPEPQPTFTPQLPPSDDNCICTPFFRCYDEETSSNLTAIVEDRTPVTDIVKTCLDPTEICCHNRFEPLSTSSTDPSIPLTPQSPSEIFIESQAVKQTPVEDTSPVKGTL